MARFGKLWINYHTTQKWNVDQSKHLIFTYEITFTPPNLFICAKKSLEADNSGSLFLTVKHAEVFLRVTSNHIVVFVGPITTLKGYVVGSDCVTVLNFICPLKSVEKFMAEDTLFQDNILLHRSDTVQSWFEEHNCHTHLCRHIY